MPAVEGNNLRVGIARRSGGAALPRQGSGCPSPTSHISSYSSGTCAGAARGERGGEGGGGRGEGARDSCQSNAACNNTSHSLAFAQSAVNVKLVENAHSIGI